MKHTLHILSWLVVFAGFSAATAHTQTVGTCVAAEAEAYLDVNNVRARILNNGALFRSGGAPVYEVPKGDGGVAIFASGIWIGGHVQDELRVAAARYLYRHFWPGPLDDNGNPPANCALFDRIYEITRDDLIAYAQKGTPTDNLIDWPWQLGAPVLDGDGDPDNYNLNGGDRPALVGDQMLWWVMNDAGNVHLNLSTAMPVGTPPIGLEVHGSAFAFRRASYIDDVTFYRYVLHYKGAAPLEEAYFSLFVDADLGDGLHDYIGSDSTLHLGFVYNEDNLDNHGDGVVPPALGYTFLRSPVADHDGRDNDRDGTTDEHGEMLGLTSFMSFSFSTCVICEPLTAQDFYYYMQARWKDGRPLTIGGNGRDFSDIPTKFFFPGDPVTDQFWSERNIDGEGTAAGRITGNGVFVVSTGPFAMQPGDEQEITFAIVWARGSDHLDSVRQLKKITARLLDVTDGILGPDVTSRVPDSPPEPTYGLGFAQNFPNPFTETTTIRYSLPKPMYIRLQVFDVLGRAVATLVDAQQHGGIYEVAFEARTLPAGVYFYRLQLDFLTFTKKMILMR